MSDTWHLPIALGVAALNAMVLWLISWRFEAKVEAIVTRHNSGLMAAVLAKHSDAERSAEDARRVALTVHGEVLDLEKKHGQLADKVERLHARVLDLEAKQ